MKQLDGDYVPVDCEFICITPHGGIDYYKKGNGLLKWNKVHGVWRYSTFRYMDELYNSGRKVYRYNDYLKGKARCSHCNN